MEFLTPRENKLFRAFLLSCQLSVIVSTRQLKCMVIKKQDKAYFCESVKKMFDDRASDLEFHDIDRPVQEVLEIQRMRLNNLKWSLFKRQYQEGVLKE
jgi:hypothetical protein